MVKIKLVGMGIAAVVAAFGIGTALAGAATPTDTGTSYQRSVVVDRSAGGFVRNNAQVQDDGNCPGRDGTPETTPESTTDIDL